MNLLGSLAIACSMYSRIPVPQVEWTKERMRYALCFFPLIGAVIGLAVYGVWSLLDRFGFYSMEVFAAAVTPLLVTGGIHMDGFLDVVDARSSCAARQKKLEILSDPHTGAFAIIAFGVYMILYVGGLWEMWPQTLEAFCGTFVLSRALSGLAVVTFPMAKESGLAASFAGQADKTKTAVVMALWAVAAEGFIWRAGGAAAGIVTGVLAWLTYRSYYRMAKREFGGITGDLAGYFLQVCELAMLLGLVVVSHR